MIDGDDYTYDEKLEEADCENWRVYAITVTMAFVVLLVWMVLR